jgi:hypothetical protein
MQVIEHNNISSFDIDNTLLMWHSNANDKIPGSIAFEYGDETIYVTPHKNHIRFLKQCSLRGDFVEVWSKNGWQHAKAAVELLGLHDYVDLVRAKPSRHIDDKEELEHIVGARIYMRND